MYMFIIKNITCCVHFLNTYAHTHFVFDINIHKILSMLSFKILFIYLCVCIQLYCSSCRFYVWKFLTKFVSVPRVILANIG